MNGAVNPCPPHKLPQLFNPPARMHAHLCQVVRLQMCNSTGLEQEYPFFRARVQERTNFSRSKLVRAPYVRMPSQGARGLLDNDLLTAQPDGLDLPQCANFFSGIT